MVDVMNDGFAKCQIRTMTNQKDFRFAKSDSDNGRFSARQIRNINDFWQHIVDGMNSSIFNIFIIFQETSFELTHRINKNAHNF